MFTGIVQELGTVKEIRASGSVHRLSVVSKHISGNANIGDSVAVNGVCLTVVGSGRNEITFEVMAESLEKTNLCRARRGEDVNLEPALRLGDKVSGHLVSGHIDGTGVIQKLKKATNTCEIRIEVPESFIKHIVAKGSIAVDGVSLTVGEVGRNWFSVYIIPHTLKSTRLKALKTRDAVNIELDLMAKYAEQSHSGTKPITEAFLREKGFI